MAITKVITKQASITGTTEILFDRYAGDNRTKLTPEQKLYLRGDEIVLPALNIMSFLSAQNTESAPKLLLDKREYKTVCSAILSSVQIRPNYIPFLRNDKPIRFGGSFDENDTDPVSGMMIVRHVARLDKGIPNPKERPMLGLDWGLKFELVIQPNPDLNEEMIENLFVKGGLRLGLGTFRKAFGKFEFSWQ